MTASAPVGRPVLFCWPAAGSAGRWRGAVGTLTCRPAAGAGRCRGWFAPRCRFARPGGAVGAALPSALARHGPSGTGRRAGPGRGTTTAMVNTRTTGRITRISPLSRQHCCQGASACASITRPLPALPQRIFCRASYRPLQPAPPGWARPAGPAFSAEARVRTRWHCGRDRAVGRRRASRRTRSRSASCAAQQ